MNKIFFTIVSLFVVGVAFSQDIEVKKFGALEKDQTAVTNPRKDINGVTCGLVKVLLKEPGAEFEGSVMGDVQFTGKEYLVYLPNGTKRLGIKHPDYLPTTIVFEDYGTKKVSSATTYELKVKTNKKKTVVHNNKKGMAIFNIKPSNAMLLIDGQVVDGSGGAYALSLPYGPHYYTVKLKDFNINNQIFAVSKDINTINVDLTTFFSRVIISSVNNDSKVYVNDEFVSNGRWEGFLPPSTYNIELRKDGCHPQSKVIELYENDSVCVSFPKMNVIGGKIKVDFKPDNSEVYIDGRLIGKTPLEFDGVSEGHHMVEIRCENYESSIHEIHMLVDQSQLLDGQLQLTDLGYLITRANNDDVECLFILGQSYRNKNNYGFEREDLVVNRSRTSLKLGCNLDKAIYWLEKAATTNDSRGRGITNRYRILAIESLSLCYLQKKDFKMSLYWAKMCNDGFLIGLHYYFGLGVPKDKQKSALYLLNRFRDDSILKKYEAGEIDDFVITDYIDKGGVRWSERSEMWSIVKEIEK